MHQKRMLASHRPRSETQMWSKPKGVDSSNICISIGTLIGGKREGKKRKDKTRTSVVGSSTQAEQNCSNNT